jgi:membrane-associated HD superfamily phosphohydrolase
MEKLRRYTAIVGLATAWLSLLCTADAATPDYKLGDVVAEDVITPVSLQVMNPEATETLKKKVAQQVPFVVRITPQSATDAETELRTSIGRARSSFLTALQQAVPGRAVGVTDLDSPLYSATLRSVAAESPRDMPLDKLAPLWVRGVSDEPVIVSLLQPLREAMAQPIVAAKDSTLPTDQPIQLVRVRSASETPAAQELESTGPTTTAGKIISLWRARRLVETYFPSNQAGLGRYASSFVRANAYPDPALTEVLRARRMEGVTVNDTYEAAQVIVRKGQIVDRRALAALGAMREKSLIGTLQTKLDQEQTVTSQVSFQTKWIAVVLTVVCLVLVMILWRLRSRPSSALVLAGQPAFGSSDPVALPGSAGEEAWRARALQAEEKAQRAQDAIRTGALGWMREKIFQVLSRQRSELLSAQQRAGMEMQELEQRLEQLHAPLQERILAYEKRIEELEKDLAAKGEENRELIGARITAAKQRLSAERERGRFGTN